MATEAGSIFVRVATTGMAGVNRDMARVNSGLTGVSASAGGFKSKMEGIAAPLGGLRVVGGLAAFALGTTLVRSLKTGITVAGEHEAALAAAGVGVGTAFLWLAPGAAVIVGVTALAAGFVLLESDVDKLGGTALEARKGFLEFMRAIVVAGDTTPMTPTMSAAPSVNHAFLWGNAMTKPYIVAARPNTMYFMRQE